MSDAGFWVAWGIPTPGREHEALNLLKDSKSYLARLRDTGQIERSDIVILKPQTIELGGFALFQGTRQQIDALRRDADFERWLMQVQLVADRVGMVDAWIDAGLTEAIALYEDALRQMDENLGRK